MTKQTPETPQVPPIDPSAINLPVPPPPPSQVQLARERAAQHAAKIARAADVSGDPGDTPVSEGTAAAGEDHP